MNDTADYASMDQPSPPNVAAAVHAGIKMVCIRRFVCYFEPKHGAWVMWIDPSFARDAQAWRNAGVVVVPYMAPGYGLGAPSAKDQMAVCASPAAGAIIRGVDTTLVIDVEFGDGGVASTGRSQQSAAEFLGELIFESKATYGADGGIYSSHVQLHDSNGLGGVKVPGMEACWLWQKTPYRLGAGESPDMINAAAPHFGAAGWDRFDYWRVPTQFENVGPFLQQTQGDARGFPGIRQCDLGRFLYLYANQPDDRRWPWVNARTGGRTLAEWQAEQQGIVADNILGPKTFAPMTWAPTVPPVSTPLAA